MARFSVEGLNELKAKIKDRIAEAKESSGKGAVVGYTMNYGLAVHENLSASHKPGKQAKFLEHPLRENITKLGSIIRTGVKAGEKLITCFIRAGLFLQRLSQKIVPIDTGALKASAFTAREEDLESVSHAAFQAGSQRRDKVERERANKRAKAAAKKKKK